MKPQILLVGQFLELINLYFQEIGEVIVEGEISELKLSQNRWLFITIKDQQASLSVFAVLSQIGNYNSLAKGMLVRVRGVPKLHQASGRFSLVATEIIPSGEGSLRMAFERLKNKLDQEGLFLASRKRAIVRFPQHLGLLTAPGSQAYNDFIKVLAHRLGGLVIYFYPIKVQGSEAVSSILSGLKYFSQSSVNIDALVLSRGGGSLDDLQAFNDEKVVRQIYRFAYPVVTGIGHEADWTLCDLVADLRASTPSNAAELLVPERGELLGQVEHYNKVITNQLQSLFTEKKNLLTKFSGLLKSVFLQYQQKLQTLSRLLNNLDYHNVLGRGYSISFGSAGQVLQNISQLKIGESIMTKLAVGQVVSKVTQLQTKDEEKRN